MMTHQRTNAYMHMHTDIQKEIFEWVSLMHLRLSVEDEQIWIENIFEINSFSTSFYSKIFCLNLFLLVEPSISFDRWLVYSEIHEKIPFGLDTWFLITFARMKTKSIWHWTPLFLCFQSEVTKSRYVLCRIDGIVDLFSNNRKGNEKTIEDFHHCIDLDVFLCSLSNPFYLKYTSVKKMRLTMNEIPRREKKTRREIFWFYLKEKQKARKQNDFSYCCCCSCSWWWSLCILNTANVLTIVSFQ